MKIAVSSPAKTKLVTVALGCLSLVVSAYLPALSEPLRLLGSLLIGGGAVSVVRK